MRHHRVSAIPPGARQTILHRGREFFNGPGGEQPSLPSVAHQFRDSGHVSAEHGPAQCHGFHNDDRQTFGKARQHQGTGGEDLTTNFVAAYPAGNSYLIGQVVILHQLLDFRAHRSVSGQHQFEPNALARQTGRRFDQ